VPSVNEVVDRESAAEHVTATEQRDECRLTRSTTSGVPSAATSSRTGASAWNVVDAVDASRKRVLGRLASHALSGVMHLVPNLHERTVELSCRGTAVA
jgi:hypothetical protein